MFIRAYACIMRSLDCESVLALGEGGSRPKVILFLSWASANFFNGP